MYTNNPVPLMQLFEELSYVKAKPERKKKEAPRRDALLNFIRENPECTKTEILNSTDLTERAVASWLCNLHKMGLIKRRMFTQTTFGGRPKFVFWVVEE